MTRDEIEQWRENFLSLHANHHFPQIAELRCDALNAIFDLALAGLDREGWVRVPREPMPGLLFSIALRFDHALGMPGYYDQFSDAQSGTHARRLEMALADARRAYEEITGQGFYSPASEHIYADLHNAVAAPSHPAGATQPTLICGLCEADRYKESCRGSLADCPMHGVALSHPAGAEAGEKENG